MGPDEGTEFDADIEAILNGGEQAQPATAPVKQEPTAPAKEVLKYGGREWDSHQSLGKAYDALLKDYSKTKNAAKAGEKWVNYGAAIEKHEELRRDLEQRIEDYNRRQAQAPRQGQEQAIPQELQDRIDRLEADNAKREMKAEIEALKSKFSPDRSVMQAVIAKATELYEREIDIPLEDVYRIVAYDSNAALSKAAGEKDGINKILAKRSANVGPSSAAAVAPGAKQVSEMNNNEYDNAIEEELKRFGVTG